MGDVSKSEKELFEQWAKPDSVQARVDHEGNYLDHGMRAAFTGWLARSKINPTTARVQELEDDKRKLIECNDQVSIELATAHEKIKELEAGMGEPVAWMTYPHLGVAGEEHLWGVSAKTSERKLADSWERKGWKVHPLFRTPPTVAAAIRKAAEVCDSMHERNCQSITESGCPPCDCYAELFRKAILAIPHDDSALRWLIKEITDEIQLHVANKAIIYDDQINAIVDRALERNGCGLG